MTSLTRTTLGKVAERETKVVNIGDHQVRIQKPTPLDYSKYQSELMGKDGKPDVSNFADAILSLVARMWIDDDGNRLFADNEKNELGSIDLQFYQSLSEQCQLFANGREASKTLGESEETIDSGLLVESA